MKKWLVVLVIVLMATGAFAKDLTIKDVPAGSETAILNVIMDYIDVWAARQANTDNVENFSGVPTVKTEIKTLKDNSDARRIANGLSAKYSTTAVTP